jgi:hypothetical protein
MNLRQENKGLSRKTIFLLQKKDKCLTAPLKFYIKLIINFCREHHSLKIEKSKKIKEKSVEKI